MPSKKAFRRLIISTIGVIVFLLPVDLNAQLIKLQDQFIGFTTDSLSLDRKINLSPDQSRLISKFWYVFRQIRDDELEERSLYGKVRFGLTGDRTNNQDFYRISSDISLKKGIYPLQFEMKTLLYILVANGKLTESLSDLWITYDQFFDLDKDGFDKDFTYEGFAYINRRNDKFLGLEQRYEVGGGIIFSHYSTNVRKDEAKIDPTRIKFSYENKSVVMKEFGEDGELEKVSSVPVSGKLQPNTFDLITQAQHTTVNSHVKMNSPFRIGVLLGLFYELERISTTDSIFNGSDRETARVEFDATSRFRWEIEPIIDFHITKNFYLSLTPQLKMPFWWNWKANVDGKERLDYRLDFPMLLEVQLSKNLSLDITYNIYYDNAPNSKLIKDVTGPNGEPQYVTANDINQFFGLQVGYRFR